jgi:hypothetical protein
VQVSVGKNSNLLINHNKKPLAPAGRFPNCSVSTTWFEVSQKKLKCFQRLLVGVADLVVWTYLLVDADDVIKRPPLLGAFRCVSSGRESAWKAVV